MSEKLENILRIDRDRMQTYRLGGRRSIFDAVKAYRKDRMLEAVNAADTIEEVKFLVKYMIKELA